MNSGEYGYYDNSRRTNCSKPYDTYWTTLPGLETYIFPSSVGDLAQLLSPVTSQYSGEYIYSYVIKYVYWMCIDYGAPLEVYMNVDI